MLNQTPKKANQISLELVHILETSVCPLSKLPRGETGKTPWPYRRLRYDYFHTVWDPLLPPGPFGHASEHSQLGNSSRHLPGRVMGHPPMAPLLSPPLGSPGFTPPTPPKGEAAWSRPFPGSLGVPRGQRHLLDPRRVHGLHGLVELQEGPAHWNIDRVSYKHTELGASAGQHSSRPHPAGATHLHPSQSWGFRAG